MSNQFTQRQISQLEGAVADLVTAVGRKKKSNFDLDRLYGVLDFIQNGRLSDKQVLWLGKNCHWYHVELPEWFEELYDSLKPGTDIQPAAQQPVSAIPNFEKILGLPEAVSYKMPSESARRAEIYSKMAIHLHALGELFIELGEVK